MVPEDFKIYYLSLTSAGQQEIIDKLLGMSRGDEKLSESEDKAIVCPHCKNSHVVGNGKSAKGVQRYLCRSCNKIFSSTTGKVWYHMHKKDKLSGYIHCLLSGFSIRKSAQEVGISKDTSFAWRHKLLTSFGDISATEFSGIVESDETYFLHSEKGNKDLVRAPRQRGTTASRDGINDQHVAVIVTLDRKGNRAMRVIKRGRIKTKDIQEELKNKVKQDSIFCTDGHPSYAGFAKRENLEHKRIIASKGQKVVEKHYHIQNVNSLDSRLKKFISKFNGVATKYLQNYINWFLVLEKVKNTTQKFKSIATIALSSTHAWYQFKEIGLNQSYLMT